MLGDRGIWHEGWKAVARHRGAPTSSEDRWELYHLADDFSESRDLARAARQLRAAGRALVGRGRRYGVLPLDDRGAAHAFAREPAATPRREFVMLPGTRLGSAGVGAELCHGACSRDRGAHFAPSCLGGEEGASR